MSAIEDSDPDAATAAVAAAAEIADRCEEQVDRILEEAAQQLQQPPLAAPAPITAADTDAAPPQAPPVRSHVPLQGLARHPRSRLHLYS